MARLDFSPSVSRYLERHAVDPGLAYEFGVRSAGDAILYTYAKPRGDESFVRRRDLGDERKITRQPADEPLILYWPAGRPEPGAEVLLCEGEPDALAALSALNGRPVAVAAVPGTAIPTERVTAELARATCIYLALDGDKAGKDAANRFARALQAFTTLKVVRLGDGEDLASRLYREADREGWLRVALEAARDAPKLKLKAEPEGYGRRKAADRKRELLARGIDPDKLDLAELLDSLTALVRRFVVADDAQTTILALWIARAHALDAADTTPYLAVTSAEKRSGKSRLLEVLAQLVPRPIEAANISEAALFRALGAGTTATLLFDEIDGTFGPKARDKEDLRSLVNAGYRRGAKAYRCVGEGAKQRVEPFEVFGPKALAGIGELPDTIADRSIRIRLHRRSRSEAVERGRYRTIAATAEPLRELLELWAEGAIGGLRDAEPKLPDELDDRAQDGGEPLLAIADLAGGEWPKRARAALIQLHAERPDEADSWGVQLLAGIRHALSDEDRISTAELLERLKADAEAPWAGWNHGAGLTARGLGQLLRRYGIRSRNVRQPDGTVPKGYQRDQFADAFARYLPSDGPENATSATSALSSHKPGVSYPLQDPLCSGLENPQNPHGNADVADVADRGPDQGPDGRDGCAEAERIVGAIARGYEQRMYARGARQLGMEPYDDGGW